MREAIEQLKEADTLLDEVEAAKTFDHIPPFYRTTLHLAHARILLAKLKLQLLQKQKEETCKKP